MLVNFVIKNRFYDSVLLMQIANDIKQKFSYDKVSVMMATEPNLMLMEETGVLSPTASATANDLLVAFSADDDSSFPQAFEYLNNCLEKREVSLGGTAKMLPHSINAALAENPQANLAFISLPGPFARYETQKALNNGLNVMIFSDNVPLADEIELKKMAREKGLLVMGPDCGTAIIKGMALGFANVVPQGPVGIAGASGTGIQELTVLLAAKGIGISHAIGTGGRDLSKDVGGITMISAIESLADDASTKYIIVISKPPHPEVAAKVIEAAEKTGKPSVICFINGDEKRADGKNVRFAANIEEAVNRMSALVSGSAFNGNPFDEDTDAVLKKAAGASAVLSAEQTFIRGLYSGGTLCEEAIVVIKNLLGDVWSNTAVFPELKLKDANNSKEHSLIDMGDDDFTRGMPHPMIDYTLRKERLRRELSDKNTAVVLLDVVLGYGSHGNPAAELAPVINEARTAALVNGRNFVVVAYLCASELDPQNYLLQKKTLEDAGVFLMPSNAQAARFAALVAGRGSAAAALKIEKGC